MRKGLCRKTRELRAIKTMKKTEEYEKLYGREIAIIKMIDHPNIVRTYDVFETKTEIHIVMEYMPGGMLYDAIADRVEFQEADVVLFAVELIDGIIYLHRSGIVHRDLKPENVLCTSKKFPLHVKIADFGLSSITDLKDMKATQLLMSTLIGTPEFVAPEIACRKKYTEKVDMWAFGMLLYNVIAGKLPIDEDGDILGQLQNGVDLKFPEKQWSKYSPDAKSFIRSLLCEDPEKRLSALGCLCHSWIQKARPGKSKVVGSHGRVSKMIFRDAPREEEVRKKKEDGLKPKKLWKKCFHAVCACNKLQWLISTRKSASVRKESNTNTFEEHVCSNASDIFDDMRTKSYEEDTTENSRQSLGGFSEGSFDEMDMDVASRVQPISLPSSLKKVFGSKGTNSQDKSERKNTYPKKAKPRRSCDRLHRKSSPLMKVGSSTVYLPERKPTFKEKAKGVVESHGPLRKISRQVRKIHNGSARKGGILRKEGGMLRKISRKISSRVGGKKKGEDEDIDDALEGLGLGTADVDDDDLLLLDDEELCGPATSSSGRRSERENVSYSPITPSKDIYRDLN